MKQEAEERRILEQQKKQVEKEESKYKNEMLSLQSQLENTVEDSKIQDLQRRLEELQQQLNAVQDKKKILLVDKTVRLVTYMLLVIYGPLEKIFSKSV